jgi:hypothetical protein
MDEQSSATGPAADSAGVVADDAITASKPYRNLRSAYSKLQNELAALRQGQNTDATAQAPGDLSESGQGTEAASPSDDPEYVPHPDPRLADQGVFVKADYEPPVPRGMAPGNRERWPTGEKSTDDLRRDLDRLSGKPGVNGGWPI